MRAYLVAAALFSCALRPSIAKRVQRFDKLNAADVANHISEDTETVDEHSGATTAGSKCCKQHDGTWKKVTGTLSSSCHNLCGARSSTSGRCKPSSDCNVQKVEPESLAQQGDADVANHISE